jgi:chromosome segregation ATPase
LGLIDELEDSRTKHQAYQFLKRSLEEAISRIQDSTSSVETDIADLQNNVSEQKHTVDILKAKVFKYRKLLNESQQAEDADLSVQTLEYEETLSKLTGELAPLEQTYLSGITQLKLLNQRHSILVSEKGNWETTLKAVKHTLGVQKRAHNKRKSAGASAGSTEPDLSNVEEWSLSSSGPRTA